MWGESGHVNPNGGRPYGDRLCLIWQARQGGEKKKMRGDHEQKGTLRANDREENEISGNLNLVGHVVEGWNILTKKFAALECKQPRASIPSHERGGR